jgi:hypothetical protein
VRTLRCRCGRRFRGSALLLTSSTRMVMAAAMGEEAEVPVWKEIQGLCTVTDLKYKSDDGGGHG